MLSEPVNYIFEYEIGAFAMFLVIMVRYFATKRFPSQTNRMYSFILWVTVLDILLDIASSFVIQYVHNIPLVVTYIINTSFYTITVLMLIYMTIYTQALAHYIDKKCLRRMLPMLLPGIIVAFLLFINPFTKIMFYVDPVNGYVHSDWFLLIYITSFVYLIFTFIVAFKNRFVLRRQEFYTIIVFLLVVLGATILQYFISELLVTGIAIMVAVGVMYFTIQNPDSMMDLTTGAFTYEAMLKFLHNRQQEQKFVQIIAVKIHNMSRINDLIGIDNGSLLLKQLCTDMRESNDGVWVFRMRGSCFVAITYNNDDYKTLYNCVSANIGQAWKIGSTDVFLQATVCTLISEEVYEKPVSADIAVRIIESVITQKNKTGERIRFINVDEALIEKNRRQQSVESELRESLVTGNGLDLHFQPLWSVAEQRYTSAEVLLRFNHPVLGSVPPNEFVEIAESCGLVTDLDEWVIRKTCELIEENHFYKTGIEHLEINLSALEFMQWRLPKLLNDIIRQYSVEPSFLCFEITETAATESFEVLKDCMQTICDYGCSFALDDFGMGYANISQVLVLPFTTIKLDKSLLYHSGEVINDMSSMFNRMNRKVVVEGVETAEQAEFCKRCQIDYIQGFYYAKPMNHTNFIEFLSKAGNAG